MITHLEVGFVMVDLPDKPGFSIMGTVPKSQRIHMALDDIAFDRIELKTEAGIVKGPARMAETMEPMPSVLLVPIIEIEVMEKGSADQTPVIKVQAMFLGEKISPFGHQKRMIINADRAMGHIVFGT